MIWIHIAVFVILAGLWLAGRLGKIDPYMNRKEWHYLLLLCLIGNSLGLCLTWKNNQRQQPGEYIDRPAYGEGDQTLEFQVQGEEEEATLTLDIPQQTQDPKEEPESEEVKKEKSFQERIRMAVSALNQEMGETDKYYLPREVDGQSLVWNYTEDHSGMVLLGLGILAGVLVIMEKKQKQQRQKEKRREQMILDYPNVLTKLCLLLQAGLTMRLAFTRTAMAYKNRKGGEKRYAYEEMLVACYEMDTGVTEGDAYENFGRRCDQVQYRTLATLLSQNLQKGSSGLLAILERESVTAFEERKRQARIQGDIAATKLLFPMILMLLVVLVILMVPAFLSFGY